MILDVDAIKIDEVVLGDNTDKSDIYIAKILYQDLEKVCRLGNVSINREVDEDRAEKMIEYINKKEAFYPTIVVATTKKNTITYKELQKVMSIRIEDDQDKFIVLDGQHRFRSISLTKDDKLKKGRYQSVLIVQNINHFKQRELFIDINDTPRRVTTGTKLRFEKTIANYFSLILIDTRDSILEYIEMDENQTSTNKNIPYKYIVKFNEKFLGILNKGFKQEKYNINFIDKFKKEILEANNFLIDLIEYSQENSIQLTKYEVFYIVLGEILSKYIDQAIIHEENINIQKIEEAFVKLCCDLEEISNKFIDRAPKTQSDKKIEIDKIIKYSLGEQ